ncbi:leukocyte receptor cluster member 8 [Euwallacea fornicatus]|uniref:leukocyte receptor cluster member 8 n=1 Tax=Euwallacea fornicatus TaxID=995702 RepID=UPI00338F8637
MSEETDVALIPPPPGISPPPLPPDDNPPLPPIPPEPVQNATNINTPPLQPNPPPQLDFWQQNSRPYYMQGLQGGYNYNTYNSYFNWTNQYFQGKAQPPLPGAATQTFRSPNPYGVKPIRFQINSKRLPNQNAMINSPNSGAAKKKRKKNRNNQALNNTYSAVFLPSQFNNGLPPLPPEDFKNIPKPEPPPEILPPLPLEVPPAPSGQPDSSASGVESAVKSEHSSNQILTLNNSKTSGANPTDDWPQSLKGYVHKCYSKCKTTIDKNQVEIILKGKITAAYQQGQLGKDWSKEPLPSIHSESQAQQQNSQNPRFTGQANIKAGLLSQFQHGPKKGLSPALGARLGGRNMFRNKGRESKSKSRSRSPSRRGRSRSPRSAKHSSSSGSEEEDFKPVIKPPQKKGKLADRLGPQKGKQTKKQKAKEKKAAFYQTFGQDVEENSELLQQRAARFNVASKLPSLSFTMDTTSSTDSAELDLTNMHIKGTCRDVEKSFLRLTKAPEACDVRCEEVLNQALSNVKDRWIQKQDYYYACDQLKSIRQDLTVQGIRNEFTVQVYETHARIALEKGDHEEFNQCQTQLKSLYSETGGENRNEFTGYRILYYVFTKNTLDIMTIMKSLSDEEKTDSVVAYALKFKSAWGIGNYHRMFSLYLEAPLMAGYLIEWFLERERKDYLKCIIKSYRQTVTTEFLVRELAFKSEEECLEFLEPFSLVFTDDSRNAVDCKSSMASLGNI